MAVSSPSSCYAFPCEVARYLALEAEDVRRLMDEDGLPYTELTKPTRRVRRVYLPAFHEWELRQAKGEVGPMRDYERWLARFNECRAGKVKSEK